MFHFRIRPPGGNRLSLSGRAGLSGPTVGSLFTKALGALTLAITGRSTVSQSGYSVSTSAPVAPVWSSDPTFSIPELTPYGPIALPVAATGYPVTVAWVSGTVNGSVTTTCPPWISFTQGLTPTITFSGAQVDANDVTNMTLSATANGQVANRIGSINVTAVSSSIVYDYAPNEGTAVDMVAAMYWQSAYASRNGTLLEWGNGTHGHTTDQGVREFDPLSKTQIYIYPSATYGIGTEATRIDQPGGSDYPGGGIPVTQYDNLHYFYIHRIDSLVIPGTGQYDRSANWWQFSNRGEVRDANTIVWTGAPLFSTSRPDDAHQLGWKNGLRLVSVNPSSLIYPDASLGDQASIDAYTGDFNPHQAWSEQLDCGVRIAGGSGGEPPRQWMWIVTRGLNFGVSNPYHVYRKDMPPTIDGVQPWLARGRDGCCFVGEYVYWVGGWKDLYPIPEIPEAYKWPHVLLPYFFRMKITPHLTSKVASLTSGEGRIERLSDVPTSYFLRSGLATPTYTYSNGTLSSNGPWMYGLDMGLLRHDPYTNSLLLISEGGLAMFDLRSMQWSLVPTPTEYATTYAGSHMPGGCLGDFIGDYISRSTGARTKLRRFYWRPGNDEKAADSTEAARHKRFRSVGVVRPADTINYLTISLANPENPTQDIGNVFTSMKHQGLRVIGSGVNRRLQLWSGDWGGGYTHTMYSPPAGYKPETTGPGTWDSARQEIWRADVGTTAINNGTARFSLVHNGYAGYPWTGSAPSFPSAQKGPGCPDAFGQIIDKRGKHWMGPCCNADWYVPQAWEISGVKPVSANGFAWGAMFSYSDPIQRNTTGYGNPNVPLGTGWTLPSQDRLINHGDGHPQGTKGVDYEVGDSLSCLGWGRSHANSSVYDYVNDKIYVLAINEESANKRIAVKLYKFDPNPVNAAANGGKYKWTETPFNYKPIKELGLPDQQWTGIAGYSQGGVNNAQDLIGRRLYFVWGAGFGSPQNGLLPNNPNGNHMRTFLMSIDIDKAETAAADAIEWIPFPESQNWWMRAWDGPDAMQAHDVTITPPYGFAPLTPMEKRSLCCVGTRLVLGPDAYTKLAVDPFIQVFDTSPTARTWTSFNYPTNSDWPDAQFCLVAVPDLGEAWIAGNLPVSGLDAPATAFRTSHGYAMNTDTAGRRIVRFSVGPAASLPYYMSGFDLTEPNISEGGVWTLGGSTGGQWRNPQTVNGIACGGSFVTGYDDCIAVLNSPTFTDNQYAQGTVHIANGYTPGGANDPHVSHEVELLLRFSISSGDAHGYEVLWGYGGNGAIVRWNGPRDSYTPLLDNRTWGLPVTGDVLRAEISGNSPGTIRVYKNGVLIDSVNLNAAGGTIYSSGRPGIGFWPQVGATLTSYGWRDYIAGSL